MITCPICPIILERTKNYFLDMKKIFTPLFIKNRYHLHLGLSFLLTAPTILFMLFFLDLADTGLFFQSFVGGFGAGCVNFAREWYYGKYYNAPYDGTDVNMGSYGGWLGALLVAYVHTLL
jgi:hypothetical protein